MFYYPSAAPMAETAPQAAGQVGTRLQHQFGGRQANTFTDWERKVSQSGSRSPEDRGTAVNEEGVGVPDPPAPQSPEHPSRRLRHPGPPAKSKYFPVFQRQSPAVVEETALSD